VYELQFEVNGQTYFLNFAEEDGEWYLLTHAGTGIRSIEIENDGGPLTGPVMLPVEDKTSKMIN
jgi:hypothetical protein